MFVGVVKKVFQYHASTVPADFFSFFSVNVMLVLSGDENEFALFGKNSRFRYEVNFKNRLSYRPSFGRDQMKQDALIIIPESLEDHEVLEYGVCPQCGRRIVLPCLACEVETLRKRNRAGHPAPPEDLTYDLSLRLNHSEQERYEDVRDFRERYGFPMWSAQWYEMIARSAEIALAGC